MKAHTFCGSSQERAWKGGHSPTCSGTMENGHGHPLAGIETLCKALFSLTFLEPAIVTMSIWQTLAVCSKIMSQDPGFGLKYPSFHQQLGLMPVALLYCVNKLTDDIHQIQNGIWQSWTLSPPNTQASPPYYGSRTFGSIVLTTKNTSKTNLVFVSHLLAYPQRMVYFHSQS